MKILLVSATQGEILPLTGRIPGLTKHSGHLFSAVDKHSVLDILVTGVGMTATAYHLASVMAAGSYDLVVNAGICGSFSRHIEIGEVLNITADQFADMGAESGEGFLDLRALGLENESGSAAGLLNAGFRETDNYATLAPLRKVTGATVNTVHGNDQSIADFRKRCQAETESMEGAAVIYACMMKDQPCLQIRAVSNYVETRNRANWNIPLAINNLNKVLAGFLAEAGFHVTG